jgi:hypothetical protein
VHEPQHLCLAAEGCGQSYTSIIRKSKIIDILLKEAELYLMKWEAESDHGAAFSSVSCLDDEQFPCL